MATLCHKPSSKPKRRRAGEKLLLSCPGCPGCEACDKGCDWGCALGCAQLWQMLSTTSSISQLLQFKFFNILQLPGNIKNFIFTIILIKNLANHLKVISIFQFIFIVIFNSTCGFDDLPSRKTLNSTFHFLSKSTHNSPPLASNDDDINEKRMHTKLNKL